MYDADTRPTPAVEKLGDILSASPVWALITYEAKEPCSGSKQVVFENVGDCYRVTVLDGSIRQSFRMSIPFQYLATGLQVLATFTYKGEKFAFEDQMGIWERLRPKV